MKTHPVVVKFAALLGLWACDVWRTLQQVLMAYMMPQLTIDVRPAAVLVQENCRKYRPRGWV